MSLSGTVALLDASPPLPRLWIGTEEKTIEFVGMEIVAIRDALDKALEIIEAIGFGHWPPSNDS